MGCPNGRTLAASTVILAHKIASMVLKDARKFFPVNPTADAIIPKKTDTEAPVRVFLGVIAKNRLFGLWFLAVATGGSIS